MEPYDAQQMITGEPPKAGPVMPPPPPTLPVPPGWPWQLRGVWTMGVISCFCFLFPACVSWCYSLKRKLALIVPLTSTSWNPPPTPPPPQRGPVRPIYHSFPASRKRVALSSNRMTFPSIIPLSLLNEGDTIGGAGRERVLLPRSEVGAT